MKHDFLCNGLTRSARQRRLASLLAVSLAMGSGISAAAQTGSAPSSPSASDAATSPAYQTAVDYVTNFYPLWFTYFQSKPSTPDQLVGPKTVSPLYQVVVAVNVDTLYASSFLDLSAHPAVLTVPGPTSLQYSVLILDPYGNILSEGMTFAPGTTYVLLGPKDCQNTPPPPNTVPVCVNAENPTIIFRTDKYLGSSDQTPAAEAFRASIKLQSLCDFEKDPTGGSTQIKPERNFAFPFKLVADTEIAFDPMLFLKQLIMAVDDPRTPALSQQQSALVAQLEALYKAGQSNRALAAGVQAAHDQIVNNYLLNQDANRWISFTDIGNWSDTPQGVLNRASLTQYIQFANDFRAAAYFQTFLDGSGQPLDGATPGGYQITFSKDQIPQAGRFWSITAYTPETIELLPNTMNKYHVAQYTRNLTYNQDGSLTLYFAVTKPDGVADANFVPVLPGKFNLMLRVYGPQGNVTQNYVPPPVSKVQ